jgi:hypothetical protein
MAEIKILASETTKSWLEVHERTWFIVGEKVFLFEHSYGAMLYQDGYEEYWIPHRYRLSHLCTDIEDIDIKWRMDYNIIENLWIHEFRYKSDDNLMAISNFIKEEFGIYMPVSPNEGKRVKEW